MARSNGWPANRHPCRIFLLSNVLSNANVTVDAVYRSDWGRIVATLIRQFGDFELAEDAAQEAFTAAVGQWRTEGLTGPGVATPFGFVDRVLMVDKGDAKPPLAGHTTVFCSLQGTVTAPLVRVYRPDLNAHLLD